ncbi:transposase [Xenorhabdus nematophila F1]|nr:transposase [Xenorhabdus nematophila F1]
MLRTMLTDSCWDTLSALMRHFGLTYHKVEHRLTLEGILYRMRTGIPWRDLPPEFGRWNTLFVRFNAWSKNGILQMIFKWLSGISDREWLFIDGSIIRAHQHSAGAATDKDEAIGKSRGGRSTKIHLAVDSQGLPVHFELSRGQTHDIKHAESLVNHSPVSDFVIADKGYDSETFRNIIKQKGATPVIPYRKNSRKSDQRLDKG